MKKFSKPPEGPLGMPRLIILGSWVTNPTLHSMATLSPIGRQIAVRSQMSCLLIWVNLTMQRSLESTEAGWVLLPHATHRRKEQPKFRWRWRWDWQVLLCPVLNYTHFITRLPRFKLPSSSSFDLGMLFDPAEAQFPHRQNGDNTSISLLIGIELMHVEYFAQFLSHI